MDQLLQLREENLRLKKAVEELSILNELARVISSTMNLESVIESVVKRSVRAIRGKQGMITLVDEQAPTEMKTLIRAQNSSSEHQQFHLNQNILGWMLINKKPLMSNELNTDNRFSGVKLDGEFRSILCVPLLVKNRLIGILAVFDKTEGNEFTEDDKRLLSIIAAQSAQILENARLYEQEKSLIVMQDELKFAAKIQYELLPREAPVIPGYEVAGKSIPAQMVGGDYFDFIPIDERHHGIALGDVSGKGLPASLLMANLQATLRGQTLGTTMAKDCVVRSNKLLYQSTSSEKFVTLFYGILDHVSHELRFCNAGHDPPFLLVRGTEVKRLRTGGIVLGILNEFPFQDEVIPISPGDFMVIYSDGIPEAMNSSKEQFGEENLQKILLERRSESAAGIIDAVVSAVRQHAGAWPQSDDMTMIVVKRTGS